MMALYDDIPLPPELAGTIEDEALLAAVVSLALSAADDTGSDPGEVGAELADPDCETTIGGQPNRWRIEGTGQAEWAMRHVAAADRQIAELKQRADEWTTRIIDWFVTAARVPLATKGFMSAHLERYALECRDADPRAKSLVLPSGRVSTTGRSPRAVIADQETVAVWALTTPGLADIVKVERSVLVSDLRKVVTIVEVPTIVLVGPCGHEMRTLDDPAEPRRELSVAPAAGVTEFADALAVGSAIICAECGEEGLVGRWLAAREHVLGPDGKVVPGVGVEPEEITAKVQAERP